MRMAFWHDLWVVFDVSNKWNCLKIGYIGGVLGPSQKFKCKQCGRAFTRRDHLKTHEKNIHGDAAGPFACKMCAQYYKNAESLRKHVAKFHLHHLANKTVLLDQRV